MSACAACKYQRRKCNPACLLAPYFPANQARMFQNVHRLFGVSNVSKILKSLPRTEHRDEAMKSMIYQSDMRVRFPIFGSYGVIVRLIKQLQRALKQLQFVQAQIEVCRSAQNSGLDLNDALELNPTYVNQEAQEMEPPLPFLMPDSLPLI